MKKRKSNPAKLSKGQSKLSSLWSKAIKSRERGSIETEPTWTTPAVDQNTSRGIKGLTVSPAGGKGKKELPLRIKPVMAPNRG